MTGFAGKLAFYFVLLAVLPLAALSWDFARAQRDSEQRLVDARLQVDLRSSLNAYSRELDAVTARAARLATSRLLARAFVAHDARALTTFARRSRSIVRDARGRTYGHRPAQSASRTVRLLASRRLLGTVEAFAPLDRDLAQRVAISAGLPVQDTLAFGPGQGSPVTVVRHHGTRFRALAAALPAAPHMRILVLTPQRTVEAATTAAWRRLGLAVLAALAFMFAVAYLEGRRVVGSIRSLVAAANAIARGRLSARAEVRGRDELAMLGRAFNDMADQLDERLEELAEERARLRQVISGFGEALAATHDDEELLRVIVTTAVEATGARGGKFISSDGRLVEWGDADAGERYELEVAVGDSTFGRLVLAGGQLNPEARETAETLVAQAAVALENSRLHSLVAREALTDVLTRLANRRHSEQALGRERARVERYGGMFSVVLADLDNFKRLNDEHGHAAGDVVLREFANVLRDAVRDADVAGRWGGEEFLLVLPDTDLDGAMQLAERVRRELEHTTILSPDGAPLRVTASLGVATATTGDDDPVTAADEALYAAKRDGRNRVVRGSALVSERTFHPASSANPSRPTVET